MLKSYRPSILLALAVIALTLMLVACGPTATPTTTAVPPTTAPPAAQPTATKPPVPTNTPVPAAPTNTAAPPTPTVPAATPTTALPDLKGRALKVGSDTTYPPFESVDQNKNIVGFDVDLAAEICKKVNCKATFITADFDALLTAVGNKTYDLSISGWTITDERAKAVDFSIAYMPNTEVLLVRGDETRFKEPEDLKSGNYVIAVQLGTTNAITAKKLVADPNKQVKEFQDFPAAVQALINKQADVVVIDTFAAADLVDQNKGKVKLSGKQFGDEYLGFVFRKGDKELVDAFNAGLRAIVKDGTWTKGCEKWWKDIAPKPDCSGKGLPWNK